MELRFLLIQLTAALNTLQLLLQFLPLSGASMSGASPVVISLKFHQLCRQTLIG